MRTRQMILGTAAVTALLMGCTSESTTVETPQTTLASSPTTEPSASDTRPGTSTGGGSDGADTTSAPSQDDGELAGVIAAMELAADTVSGEPFDVEQDDRDGRDVWEIKVAAGGDEYKVWVTPDGTEVIDQELQDDPDDDVDKVGQAEVSAVDALRIAAAEQTGMLDEMEIDTRDGTVVWEVEFIGSDGSEIKVVVDATTGAILDPS